MQPADASGGRSGKQLQPLGSLPSCPLSPAAKCPRSLAELGTFSSGRGEDVIAACSSESPAVLTASPLPHFSPTRARCSSAHPGLQHLEEPWHSRCPCHCADTPRHVNAFLSCRKSPARSQRLEKKTAAWTGAVCIPFCCWEGRKEPTQSSSWRGAPLSSPSLITKEVPWSKGLEAHGAHHPLGYFTLFSSPKAQLKHYPWR